MTSVRYNTIIPYIDVKDESDLYAFLRLNEEPNSSNRKDCELAFRSMTENKYYVPREGLLTSIPFVQIIWVWEVINKRFALWSDHKLEVASHESWRYNFLDKGNIKYDELLLSWEPNDSEKKLIIENIDDLKNVRNDPILTKRDLPIAIKSIKDKIPFPEETPQRHEITLQRIKSEEEIFTKSFDAGIFNTDTGIGVNLDKAEYGGLAVGIKGVDIKSFYSYPDEVRSGNISFEGLFRRICGTITDIYFGRKYLKYLGWAPLSLIAAKLRKNLSKSKFNLDCGAFEIEVARRKEKGRTVFYIGGVRVSRGNLADALERALYYETPKQYTSFLEEIKEVPTVALKLLEEGITINLREDGETDAKVMHFDVKRENKEYIIYSYNKEFICKSGYRKLASLKREFEMSRRRHAQRWTRHFDRWGIYQRVANAFGKEEALEIVELGLKYYKEAETKAKEFVQSIIKENAPNIVEGEFMNYGQGWFVRGMRNSYFIDQNNKSYFVEPENKRGQYICMFTPARVSVPKHDKIASTMLALLSDERIARRVHTLGITGEV